MRERPDLSGLLGAATVAMETARLTCAMSPRRFYLPKPPFPFRSLCGNKERGGGVSRAPQR